MNSPLLQALTFASVAASITNLVLIIYLEKSVPVIQSYILEPISLAAAASLTYYNHTRTRTSSSVLLLFWPLYVTGLAIWTRTIFATNLDYYRVILSLKYVVVGLGVVSFALEILGPEFGIVLGVKSELENPTITANIFSIWVSVLKYSTSNLNNA